MNDNLENNNLFSLLLTNGCSLRQEVTIKAQSEVFSLCLLMPVRLLYNVGRTRGNTGLLLSCRSKNDDNRNDYCLECS